MTNIPTDLLRTFVTIKDLGGFTSAGELLGRSQPAISLQVKKLEEILNTKIFLRGSSLELTEDGEYLYESARNMLEINDQIIAKVKGDNVSGKVRLGKLWLFWLNIPDTSRRDKLFTNRGANHESETQLQAVPSRI